MESFNARLHDAIPASANSYKFVAKLVIVEARKAHDFAQMFGCKQAGSRTRIDRFANLAKVIEKAQDELMKDGLDITTEDFLAEVTFRNNSGTQLLSTADLASDGDEDEVMIDGETRSRCPASLHR